MENTWLGDHTFHHGDFADLAALVAEKRRRGLSVSVALPTLNVGKTLGPILQTISGSLMGDVALVDQLAVVDSHSTDDTRDIAARWGAEVYVDSEIMPGAGSGQGKGEALWKSLAVLSGDIIVWIDSDIANFHPRFVYGLVGPLLMRPELGYVKAFYQRPLIQNSGAAHPTEGGRVTEICARPILNLFYPELANLIQPLSGESAGRRTVLEAVPFFTDYAVEIGLLLNIYRQFGMGVMGQVDLDERIHTNQPLKALGKMSFAILQAVFQSLSRDNKIALSWQPAEALRTFMRDDGRYLPLNESISVIERPPMLSMPDYRQRTELV